MRHVLKVVASTAVALAISSSIVVLAPGSASATAEVCSGGRAGFVDISDNLTGTEVRRRDGFKGGWVVTLQTGNVNGVQRGWAHLTTAANSSVWMDWTQNGGSTWLQCGPFSRRGASTLTSAAQRLDPSPAWQFRACFKANAFIPDDSGVYCTTWW